MEETNQFLSIVLLLLFFVNGLLKSNDRFLIILTNAMNGLGIIYYSYGGELYKKPSDPAIYYLLLISISINISYMLYAFVYKHIKITKTNESNYLILKNKIFFILISPLFILPLLYFLTYYNHFPIYYMLLGEVIGEASRPDVSGSLPHFYSFSVFLSSITFPFLIMMYSIEDKNYIKTFIFMLIVFFALLLGDKSTLLTIIFYFMFIKNKVKIKNIIFFVCFFVLFYMSVKYAYYQELRFEDTYALYESIFRRVCLIGPSTFGAYIDYFLLENGTLPDGVTFKRFLFYLIYGNFTGGAPVFFPASYLNFINIGFMQILLTGTIFLIILIVRNIIYKLHFSFFKK